MITVRKAEERGHADHGWLKTHHTFSFAGYYDPDHMGFRFLRVINDDWIAPARGFGAHPHQEMEIVTYVLQGELEHRDGLGNRSVIRPGRVQRMSAGTGIVHSEANPSPNEPVRLLQIWLLPGTPGVQPGYEERDFAPETLRDRLALIVAPGGGLGQATGPNPGATGPNPGATGLNSGAGVAPGDAGAGALAIHQDVRIYAARLSPGTEVRRRLEPGRHAWLQIATGAVRLNGVDLAEGDGAAVSGETNLALAAGAESELLLFDLA